MCLRNDIVPRITSTTTVQQREFQLRDQKIAGNQQKLPMVGVNVGFTQAGLSKLKGTVNLGDPSYAAGAAVKAAGLGDVANATGIPTQWLPPFTSGAIDGVILMTGGTQAAIDHEKDTLMLLLGASVTVVQTELGQTRPGAERGHEHFGWLDGISQPAIEGLTTPFPGQEVLPPGLFVFGYPGVDGQPLAMSVPWMLNGSFMVFRHLSQLVPEFNHFLQSASITAPDGLALGMDPELLGARMIGRWKSGAPLESTPMQDDPAVGIDPNQNNNFDYSDDQAQRRCPFGAHIRKTNPRADVTKNILDPRRIIRAGIPFGPEVTDAENSSGATQNDRGLLFVCYQTSIVGQFEFLQSSWASPSGFVFGKTRPTGGQVVVGNDPLIGQTGSATSRARTTDEPVPNYPTGNTRSTLNIPQDFIVPKGGAYFFVPSVTALRTVLAV